MMTVKELLGLDKLKSIELAAGKQAPKGRSREPSC